MKNYILTTLSVKKFQIAPRQRQKKEPFTVKTFRFIEGEKKMNYEKYFF
jgi:hypothetical protein